MVVQISPALTNSTVSGEDSYLEKAKKYDFGKDLGAKYAVGQVWKLTRQDFKYYVIGVGFTMLGAGPDRRLGGTSGP